MSGRAIAIAQLIRMHGPMRAVEIVKEANAEHRRLHPSYIDYKPPRRPA